MIPEQIFLSSEIRKDLCPARFIEITEKRRGKIPTVLSINIFYYTQNVMYATVTLVKAYDERAELIGRKAFPLISPVGSHTYIKSFGKLS